MKPARAQRRHAARELAARYSVPVRVAMRTVDAVLAGRATGEVHATTSALLSQAGRIDRALALGGFPEVGGASEVDKATWTQQALDDRLPIATRQDAMHRLAVALGAFPPGQDDDEAA